MTLRFTPCGVTPPEELCLPTTIPGEPDGAIGFGDATTWTRLLVGERPEGLGKVVAGTGGGADTSGLAGGGLDAEVPLLGTALMLIGAIGLTVCWAALIARWVRKQEERHDNPT
jgi:hypothetical protein